MKAGQPSLALTLRDAPNPILTRELVYTGITRARHWLTLVETGRGQLMDVEKGDRASWDSDPAQTPYP